MNPGVFVWTSVTLAVALLVIQRHPRRPFEPTVLDLIFAFCIALLVSLRLPA